MDRRRVVVTVIGKGSDTLMRAVAEPRKGGRRPVLAARLRAAGHAVAARFTWAASAAEHQASYARGR